MDAERPIALPNGQVFHSDPKVLGGTPVFVGTRVPVRTLIEYLEGGYKLDEYLDSFRPCVASRQWHFSRRRPGSCHARWRETGSV